MFHFVKKTNQALAGYCIYTIFYDNCIYLKEIICNLEHTVSSADLEY